MGIVGSPLVGLRRRCHPSKTEVCGYAPGGRSLSGVLAGHWHVLLVSFLLAAALLLRIDGLSEPSLSTREHHNALLAREYYLGRGAGLPAWKQRVLAEYTHSVKPVEPPLLDHVAGWAYRLTGGENIWIPRFISALLWVLGGAFLYLVARRITGRDGALVALALYLFWPYGVVMSRLYIPDPTMVCLIIAGALTVIRYWEHPTGRRLAAASVVAALATAVKPGIALIFLGALFTALAVAHRSLLATLRRGVLPGFVAIAAAPTVAYYLYGSYIRHFLASEGAASERLQPQLIATGRFWDGWWHQLSVVLPFPQQQGYLGVVPLAVALVGVVVVRGGVPRAILVGLGLGYVAYAFAVAGYTRDNAYYALPLLPILALAIGALVGLLLGRLNATRRAPTLAAAALIVLIACLGAYKARPLAVDRTAIDDYRRIGALTGHTTHAIIVDERLRAPAMYWGWMVGNYWYEPTPGRDLPLHGNPFPDGIDAAEASHLVVVDTAELQSEPRLRAFIRNLPVIAKTTRYAIFDLRGGRALDADRGGAARADVRY